MTIPQRWVRNIRAVSSASFETMHVLCIDSETEMVGDDADPAPYGPRGARPLLWALRWNDCVRSGTIVSHYSGTWEGHERERVLGQIALCDLLVGHNLKFDWQHLISSGGRQSMRQVRLRAEWAVWDTMVAEYIITAQRSKFAKLGDLVEKYAPGHEKQDILDNYIARGFRTQDIPLTELAAYAVNDVTITTKVAQAQWEKCDQKQRHLIMLHSWLSLIFAEGEYAGFRLDLPETVRRSDAHGNRVTAVAKMFREVACEHAFYRAKGEKWVVDECGDVFTTPSVLSALMFGSPQVVQVEAPLPTPIGRMKYAKAALALSPSWGVLDPAKFGAKKHAKANYYTMDDKVLTRIVEHNQAPHSQLAEAILASRDGHKKAVTYYGGLLEHRSKYDDERVHHTINVTSTNTGRASSSNPNAQNQPEEVREVFLPDTDAGRYVEFDFKQLEIGALARLSEDPKLILDLKTGTDMHYEVGRQAGAWTKPSQMTKDERRRVKSVVFGLIYGGGANTLSEQAGMPVRSVQKIIKAFYDRYPGVKAFHDELVKDVSTSRGAYDARVYRWVEDVFVPAPTGNRRVRIVAPMTYTGRLYAFEEYKDDSEGSKRPAYWMPTNLKNYIVQGFGTGDVVPCAIAAVDEELPDGAYVKLAVHDSALTHVSHPTDLDDSVAAVEKVPALTRSALLNLFDVSLGDVPLNLSAEIKQAWGGKPLKAWEITEVGK